MNISDGVEWFETFSSESDTMVSKSLVIRARLERLCIDSDAEANDIESGYGPHQG
jgi:hypothetical protein